MAIARAILQLSLSCKVASSCPCFDVPQPLAAPLCAVRAAKYPRPSLTVANHLGASIRRMFVTVEVSFDMSGMCHNRPLQLSDHNPPRPSPTIMAFLGHPWRSPSSLTCQRLWNLLLRNSIVSGVCVSHTWPMSYFLLVFFWRQMGPPVTSNGRLRARKVE